MNTDKHRWLTGIIACCFVILCPVNLQAVEVAFELSCRPEVQVADELADEAEPILSWGFPMSNEHFKPFSLNKSDFEKKGWDGFVF